MTRLSLSCGVPDSVTSKAFMYTGRLQHVDIRHAQNDIRTGTHGVRTVQEYCNDPYGSIRGAEVLLISY
jgi:hypothetical protein